MDLRAVSAALGAVVLERVDPRHFLRISDAPAWWHARFDGEDQVDMILAAEAFPFLAVFLPDAERVWSAAGMPPVASELWSETDAKGEEVHLEAIAARAGEACVLVIARNEQAFTERQLMLQRARELRFTYDALMREIERKDILLHTIVHDLTAPLHSVVGSLSLLRECALPADAMRWVELAIQAAARQRELIAGILNVFVSEQAAGAARETTPVDLRRAAERALSERQPVARQRGIVLVADLEHALPVLAEETRLIRVLTNLLDNAIRHGPPGSQVRLTCTQEADAIRVSIEDEGPGVSPDLLPRLFEKLVRDPRGGGGTGLGLYFCRITIEQWAGGIGYEPRPSGGATFWIRLPAGVTDREQPARTQGHGEVAVAR